MVHDTRARFASAALFAAACGGKPSTIETAAPLCADVAPSATAKEVFTTPVVPVASVLEALVFGGMDPGTLEPINFELGFRLKEIAVPVTAPGDLYLRSLESTRYTRGSRAGEVDFGMSFDVCAKPDEAGRAQIAVEGEFAHISTLSAELQAILDGADLNCQTSTGADEDNETCAVRFEPSADAPVLTTGSAIGTAGGTGLTAYAPGFDFNLLDTRFPVPWLNPDRLGDEENPGRWFRYGACVYDYFTNPTRDAYLGLVGQNGQPRVDANFPCGRLDLDVAGTGTGLWMRADKTDLRIAEDWVAVLSHVLVFGPHPLLPESHEVLSTELLDLASFDGRGILLEYEAQGSGDVNPRSRDLVPGTIYCIESEGYLNPTPFYHHVALTPDGELRIERLDASCAVPPVGGRTFGANAVDFVR